MIAILKETATHERRIPVVPKSIQKLAAKGAELTIESGLGLSLGFSDQDYQDAGAKVCEDRTTLLKEADIVLRLAKPELSEVGQLKAGSLQIGYLDPFNEPELLGALAKAGVSAVSMEMMPRSTIAQKMDVLSSQANLAGYVSVLLAANRSDKIFPMMTTPAGTISPARVFVIGVGVAGLQAIATAKRLGARVEAFDTRPVVEEQVQSLGAKFVKIDLGETGQTKDGYAKQLSEEQVEKQRQGMAKVCSQSDVVITTAQLFGRKAPVIVTKDMVEQMMPGSVIVDMAVESGGNVEGSKLDEEVTTDNGVHILGYSNLPGKVPLPASEMYSANLANFILHFWDDQAKNFRFDLNDEILKGCVVTHAGEIVHEMLKGK